MEITTKFSIGEKVYGINCFRKMVEFTITHINIYVRSDIEVNYAGSDLSFIEEKYCFKTKDERNKYINE